MRSVDEILDKIKELQGFKKDAELADFFGVSRSAVASWRGRQNLPYGDIVAFCEREQVNLSWLLTGQLTTKYIDVEGQKVLTIAQEQGTYKAEDKDFVTVPQVRGEISAGGGLLADETVEMRVAFRRDWIERHGEASRMSLIRVAGDSMEPTLYSGDLVLVDHSRNVVEAAGGIFAIALDHEIMIKRVQLNYPGKTLRIISDNEKYETFEADPDKITVNGKVIWFGRELER